MTKSGEIETNSLKTKEAIIKMLQEMSGNADKASKSYGAALNQYNNQITALKVQIGQNLLPLLTSMTQKATDFLKVMEQYPGLTQGVIALSSAVLGIVAVGVPLAGTVATIAGAGIKILAVSQELGGLSGALAGLTGVIGSSGVAALRFAGIWGIVAAAIGTATKAYLDYQAALSVKEQEKTAEVLNNQAKSIRAMAELYNNVKSPMEGIKALQADIIKGGVEWGNTAEGQARIAAGLQLVNDTLIVAQSNLKQYEAQLRKTGYDYDLVLQIKNTQDFIKTLEEAGKGFSNFTTQINDTKSFEGIKKTFSDLQSSFKSLGKWEFKVSDEDLQKFIKQQNDFVEAGRQTNAKMLSNLNSYKEKYKLSKEQELEIDKKIMSAKEKVASDEDRKADARKKKQEELIKSQSDAWTSFVDNLKLALSSGDISEQQFYERVKKYLLDNAEALKGNVKLRLEIQEMYYSGVDLMAEKQAAKERERQEKALQEEKERKEKQIAWGQELLQEEYKKQEEADKKAKDAEDKRIEANKELNKILSDLGQSETEKAISRIQEQADKFREAKADEIKIEEYTQKSIQKLQEETMEQFKEKEKQKRDEIQATLSSITGIEQSITGKRKERADLLMSYASDTPLMSMEQAFNPDKNPETQRWKKIAGKDEEIRSLEEERDRLFKKLKEQKEEEKKLQDEITKATDALNVALGQTADAYDGIRKNSPWKNEIELVKQLNEEIKKANSSAGSKGSATAQTGGAISTPEGQAGTSSSLGEYKPRLSTMLSGVTSVLNSASSVINNSNTSIDNRRSSQASTVNNNYTVNVDGRSQAANAEISRATNSILSAAGQAKYLTRRT